mmetsp:Transcript_62590/g.162457  ORF Transcript_62590/g.162457 Transcript_62590/m.162457 type:complete len:378 (+) Transcript_62590:90-1223(+)
MFAQAHAIQLLSLRRGEVDEDDLLLLSPRIFQRNLSGSTSAETPRGHGASFDGGAFSEDEDDVALRMVPTRSKADSDIMPHMVPTRSRVRKAQEVEQLQAVLGFQIRVQPPRILCVSRRHMRKNKYVDIVGEYHLDLVQGFGGVPVIIPRTTHTLQHLMQYLPMDGLLVAEGNDMSDGTLLKYGCCIPGRLDGEDAQKFASDTEFDLSKDELEFALMKFALAKGCPILGLCRGSQMLNVMRGGTLIGDIESEVGHEIVHLLDGSDPAYDSHRHPIRVTPGTPLAGWFADDLGTSGELLVNSYHHQGVKKLGEGLVEMAWAPDGVLEGFYDPTYDPESGRFVVGLQFHPERMLQDYAGCAEVYKAFGRACWAYQRSQL